MLTLGLVASLLSVVCLFGAGYAWLERESGWMKALLALWFLVFLPLLVGTQHYKALINGLLLIVVCWIDSRRK
jgi:hypothetical protein